MALETEISTYEAELPNLLSAGKGKFVLIHKKTVVGTFSDMQQAFKAAYQRFPDEPFLVREIQETQPVIVAPRTLRPCPH